MARPSEPAPDLKTCLGAHKGKPVSHGSVGRGGIPHLTADHVLHGLGKLGTVHLPSERAAPALNATMANLVPLASGGVPPAVPLVRAGQVKALAATSLGGRIASLPQAPPAAESGFANVEDCTWTGLFGRAGLPADVRRRLNEAGNEALKSVLVRERVDDAGLEGTPGAPAATVDHLRREVAKWSAIVTSTGASQP